MNLYSWGVSAKKTGNGNLPWLRNFDEKLEHTVAIHGWTVCGEGGNIWIEMMLARYSSVDQVKQQEKSLKVWLASMLFLDILFSIVRMNI